MLNADMIYEAADYLRLSKEDGDFSLSNDKLESDSISSQRAIIERFVAQNPNIKLVSGCGRLSGAHLPLFGGQGHRGQRWL